MGHQSGNLFQKIASLFRTSRIRANRGREPGKSGSEQVKGPTTSRRDRAPRFSAARPLSYRPQGALDWRESTIQNISRSGVLFQVQFPLRLDTVVEMMFKMPAEITGKSETTVICRAKVARRASSGFSSLVAVSILNLREAAP